MEEIWKAIPGYEGIYEASTRGQIRSLDHFSKEFNNHGTLCRIRIKGRLMKPGIDQDGYLVIQLTDSEGDPGYYSVHRLVALTFIDNPDPTILTQVDHLDCDKTNNCVDNLEWVTCKENINRAWKNDRCTPRVPDDKQIRRFTQLGKKSAIWRGQPCRCIEENKYFFCIQSAANYYGVNGSTLRHWIINGRGDNTKKCNGLHFEYVSKDCPEYHKMLSEFLDNIDKW